MAAAFTAAARDGMGAALDQNHVNTRKPARIYGPVGRIAMMAALGFTLAACEMQNSPFASRSATAPDQIAATTAADGEMAESIVEGEITSAALVDPTAADAAVAETPATVTPAAAAVTTTAKPTRQQRNAKLVERDIEAPQVFQTNDTALWDGRPSLGGVWIASPDAKDPERVIMRNPANGKFVIGALFRRERDNPGPTLQISSDAAEALGVLAGQPVKLNVVALRREEGPVGAPAPGAAATDTTEAIASSETAAPAAGRTAAAAPATAGKPTETAAIAAPAAATPKRGNRAIHEAAAAALLAAPAGKAAAPGRAAAAPRAAAPVAPTPAVAAATAAPAAGGRAIQIGIFSVEANAKRASDALAKAGVPAQIRSENTKGKTIWSVTSRGDGATLQKIKAAGFGDAYLMK